MGLNFIVVYVLHTLCPYGTLFNFKVSITNTVPYWKGIWMLFIHKSKLGCWNTKSELNIADDGFNIIDYCNSYFQIPNHIIYLEFILHDLLFGYQVITCKEKYNSVRKTEKDRSSEDHFIQI